MQARAAKNNALKALKTSSDIEETFDDEILNEDENAYFIPYHSQNAPEGYTLDLFKQYKRQVEYCDRDLVRIHDRNLNKKDKGSKDRGLIYIDFKAGMFEALKVNFLNCLMNNFDTKLIADPKIEFYGQALERICLDLSMKVSNHSHDVKIKVHNTKCSIDVAALHDEVGKTFEHLFNLTVGEYFAKHVVVNIVEMINSTVNITELNEHLRFLATEGKKAVLKVKKLYQENLYILQKGHQEDFFSNLFIMYRNFSYIMSVTKFFQ